MYRILLLADENENGKLENKHEWNVKNEEKICFMLKQWQFLFWQTTSANILPVFLLKRKHIVAIYTKVSVSFTSLGI